jgi:hypothetical protein
MLKLVNWTVSSLVQVLTASAMSAKKRAGIHIRNPLNDAGILKQVLGFVGPGHWLFVAEVSKLWQQIYKAIAAAYLPKAQAFDCLPNGSKVFSCRPHMTLAQAVFASASRLKWAHDAGLSIVPDTLDEMQNMGYLAGLLADQTTLAAALYSNMGITSESDSVVLGVAASGCTAKMEWLCSQRLQPLPWYIMSYGASSGSLDMLRLLRQAEATLCLTSRWR